MCIGLSDTPCACQAVWAATDIKSAMCFRPEDGQQSGNTMAGDIFTSGIAHGLDGGRIATSTDACVHQGCCAGDYAADCRPPLPLSVRGGGLCPH